MAVPEEVTERSLGGHMMHGSSWMIAMRWSIRLTGLLSTIILARLLTPADFGIVTMAMLVVGLLEQFGQAGQRLAIIRIAEPNRTHYDTAWTISIIVGLAIAAAILFASLFVEPYFKEPRSIVVMQCLALRAVIGGMENIGTVDFQRNIRFDRFFLFNVSTKLISFVVTVSLAFALRNYWALVIGMLASQVASVVLSYIMHPYRPRVSLAAAGEIWSFSLWTLARTLGSYLSGRVDLIAISGVSGATAMGHYAVANDVASSPSTELNAPMVAVLYSVMAKVQHDIAKVRSLYLRVVGWSASICAATSVGIAVVATDFVNLVLGPKWSDIIPIMGYLAVSAALQQLCNSAYSTFDSMGVPHRGAAMQWTRVTFMILTVAPVALIWRDLELIAITRMAVTAVFVPTLFLAVGQLIQVTARDYVAALWRPIVSAATMAAAVLLVNAAIDFAAPLRLATDVAVGALAYGGSILLLWHVSGRPNTPERDVAHLISKLLSRQRQWAFGLNK